MRIAVRVIAILILLTTFFIEPRLSARADALFESGARQPNEATGETFEVVFRGQQFRYVKKNDFIAFHYPFWLGPLLAFSILWLGFDLKLFPGMRAKETSGPNG